MLRVMCSRELILLRGAFFSQIDESPRYFTKPAEADLKAQRRILSALWKWLKGWAKKTSYHGDHGVHRDF